MTETRVGHLKILGDDLRSPHSQDDPDDPADQAENQGLDQELPENIAAPGAHGHADADLPGPLGHRNQHDVHDPDPAHQEGNGGDGPQENGHDPGRFLGRGKGLRKVADGEIIILVGSNAVPLAEELGDLIFGQISSYPGPWPER